jgi:hypothetical protein
MDIESIKKILLDNNNLNFNTLLESVLTEAIVDIDVLESDSKYHVDENNINKHTNIKLDKSDFVLFTNPGTSISRSRYIFSPMPFSLNLNDGAYIVKYIKEKLETQESVDLEVIPGYGVDGENIYPANTIKVLTHEERVLIQDQLGKGHIIIGIDGQKISSILKDRVVAQTPETDREPRDRRRREWVLPKWLESLNSIVSEMKTSGNLRIDPSRIKGFEYEWVYSTNNGDAVMLLGEGTDRAAYIVKKKVVVEPTKKTDEQGSGNMIVMDYDAYMNDRMVRFTQTYNRRQAGTTKDDIPMPNLEIRRVPKLAMRDELEKFDNGFALRRDFRVEDIRRILENGINYQFARQIADSTPTRPVRPAEPN